jgi:glutamine---fructose-6-phosphate transaminase (isomerizing)
MCGIFGIALASGHGFVRNDWDHAVNRLFILSQSRGKEAAGLAIATRDRIVVHKDSTAATTMLKTPDYRAAVNRGLNGQFGAHALPHDDSLAAIGHCRLVTNGLQGIDANNQPVWRDGAIVVHNGIVVNVDDLWARHPDIKPRAEVDTEVIAALIEKHRAAGVSVIEATQRAYREIIGETSVAILFRDLNAMLLATNTGSLFITRRPDGKAFFFASESHICRQLITGERAIAGFNGATTTQIRAGEGVLIDLGTLEWQSFALTPMDAPAPLATPQLAPKLGMQRAIDDKAQRYADARANMRRCTKCLLPETMPFIVYDGAGICNYCHNYQPWVRRPESELVSLLDKHRKADKSPDCVMAFSGGRDSSYGLHLLKTKYDMTPMCFSYDWGMVTDLARRNQARMCGQLGIEHIWVSADIKQKRDNIRRNVTAWLKKPDIGMIPLFIAGDKHAFVEANKIMDQVGLDLMAFCPNKLEKTEFKTGFCGIPPDASETQPFALSQSRKLKLIKYYGQQFLSNPAYFNRSLADTFTGYISLYYKARNYLYMFDYIDWDEETINKTLIGEYDWETSPETRCTWRIGDGTAPLYNYVYLTVAGFTEHDTFRSNQIREGQLTREAAWDLVTEENVPRWGAFREYTQLINVDFDEVVRRIDRIPKLYVKS